MRVAIVHYWLVNMRGGERVLAALCDLYPQADVFTHVYDPARIAESVRRHNVQTTWIAKLPGAKRFYKSYLALMPLALEALDLRSYDLVISSESGPAKGVITSPSGVHVCYCHSPMRYVWDMSTEYVSNAGRLTRLLAPLLLHYLRMWDVTTAHRVDKFVANSHHVRRRIARYYGREAAVIPPPVEVESFHPTLELGDHYLVSGQLVRYKRVDLAIQACNELRRKLVIIGEGEELPRLKSLAGPTIQFLGWQPDGVVREYMARSQALLFAGEEDFGIVPVEVMAAGRPVIAYASGGVLDSVIDGETGILFPHQTAESLVAAIKRYEGTASTSWQHGCVARAAHFHTDAFARRFRSVVDSALAARATEHGRERDIAEHSSFNSRAST